MIQSFYWRTLLKVKKTAPAIETACLTSQTGSAREGGRLRNMVGELQRFERGLVKEAHELHLKVVPWTINCRAQLTKAMHLEVDGVITDYPDRAREVMATMGVPLAVSRSRARRCCARRCATPEGRRVSKREKGMAAPGVGLARPSKIRRRREGERKLPASGRPAAEEAAQSSVAMLRAR